MKNLHKTSDKINGNTAKKWMLFRAEICNKYRFVLR